MGDQQTDGLPTLRVLAEKSLKVTVMSEFEMLRRRIMAGMANRKP